MEDSRHEGQILKSTSAVWLLASSYRSGFTCNSFLLLLLLLLWLNSSLLLLLLLHLLLLWRDATVPSVGIAGNALWPKPQGQLARHGRLLEGQLNRVVDL